MITPNFNKLSILIPAYNESESIIFILDKVLNVTLINNIEKEIIIVNDFSTDDTEEVILKYISTNKFTNMNTIKVKELQSIPLLNILQVII